MPAASRTAAIDHVTRHFDDGDFFADLARRIAIPTSSQEPERRPALMDYLRQEMAPCLKRLGYTLAIHDNPVMAGVPLLLAQRIEDANLPTVLTYGHGDVIRGLEGQWSDGRDPWTLTPDGDRLYGRGTADNKGQHSINLAALASVLATRGKLGFNSKILIETGEEVGSPGLREFCTAHKDALTADMLLASDGPRLGPTSPTIFMGTRGALNFTLAVDLREGGHHSGNWGGLLANPGVILAHAIAGLVGPRGEILLPELKPAGIAGSVRAAIANCHMDAGPTAPSIDPDWGEPGLTPSERVFAWNTFEVLAFVTGNPDNPVNAIPPRAEATCQIRFTVDTDPEKFLPAIRRHLDATGFEQVQVEQTKMVVFQATRLDPDHPVARWAAASVARTVGKPPMMLPNLGGSLPNDIFANILGLPTIWVPHSYAACSQHAPNEHMLASIAREGLQIMAGLFWDLGAGGFPKAMAD